MKMQLGSFTDDPGGVGHRIQRIVEFWSALHLSGDSGATSWEELDKLEQEVTDCLARQPPDVKRAESLTARAMLLIACGLGS